MQACPDNHTDDFRVEINHIKILCAWISFSFSKVPQLRQYNLQH
jgi:hypothetical protein